MDNKELTKQRIAVMQAYVDGATIEYSIYGRDAFISTDKPLWISALAC